MKCDNCEQEMVKGLLSGDSQHWIPADTTAGKLNKVMAAIFANSVWAWKCENCKKINFYSE